MKVVRLSELQEILQGAPFAAWLAELNRANTELRHAAERHQDLLAQAELMELRSELVQRAAMDAFSDAGGAEEAQARAAADAQELENRALGLVGHHEEQRFKTSDLWYRLGGLERTLEETSDPAARLLLERQLPGLKQEYGQEDQRRDRLWSEVEETWARSFERSLLSHEHGDRARRIRREAERLFKEADERRQRARQLKGEAEAAGREETAASQHRGRLLERAGREFGCVHGDRFLYWRHRDDQRASFAVALVDDAEGYNVDVRALSIFTVGPQRGVGFLEPARDGLAPTVQEGDRRFEAYLLGPRQGARPGGPGGSPSGAAGSSGNTAPGPPGAGTP
jgi:hypothetical protein